VIYQLDQAAGVSIEAGDTAQLHRIPVDGRGAPYPLLNRPGTQTQGLLTPDGRSLVFVEGSGTETGQDIMIVDLDDPSGARPLVRTRFSEGGIALSPDGSWLAYQSDETGAWEVYVRRLRDGEGGTRWPVSSAGGTTPRWSPDGTEIFYRNSDSLYAAPIALGEGRPDVGAPRALFYDGGSYTGGGRAMFDVHPDGQRFVVIRGRPDILVMVNGLQGVITGR